MIIGCAIFMYEHQHYGYVCKCVYVRVCECVCVCVCVKVKAQHPLKELFNASRTQYLVMLTLTVMYITIAPS